MIDLIKKLYDWENNPNLIRDIENLTDSEIIEQFERKGKISFFEKLFKMVEDAKTLDKKVPFRFFFYRDDTFIVKVKGLFARLSFENMAWHYPDPEYWKIIFPTLQGVEYKGKVLEAAPPQEEGERFHIIIDARAHTFYVAELIDNAEYNGIVLQKTEDEVLIDIGVHFKWKYGSLCGYLPLEDLATPETFQACQPGDIVTIEYIGENERGLQFTAIQAVDLAEYVGKITWVQIGRGTAPYYMVEGKYKADLPITKTHYPTNKKKVRKLREQWENGDIIQCEILEYKPHRGFIVKWIDDEPNELDWRTAEMAAYVGQKVPVQAHWTDEGELEFFVENKFPATFSGRDRSAKKEHLREGQVITALIRSIDFEEKCFKIRWVPWWDDGSSENESESDSEKITDNNSKTNNHDNDDAFD